MKFNPDTALQIMRAIENYPKDTIPLSKSPLIPDMDREVYSYHCRLLGDAGYIEVFDLSSHDGFYFCPSRICWMGVQFLEQFRNDSMWQRAKDVVSEKGVGITLDILLQTGKQLAEEVMRS